MPAILLFDWSICLNYFKTKINEQKIMLFYLILLNSSIYLLKTTKNKKNKIKFKGAIYELQ